MRFEIVLAPSTVPSPPGSVPSARAVCSRHGALEGDRTAHQLLDMFIDGANVTARVRETHGALVLRDLAAALVELGRWPRAKATVRFHDEPWELCVERHGATACLSVYRAGPDPVIAAYDRAVPFDDVVLAVAQAIDGLLSDGQPPTAARVKLAGAADDLRALALAPCDPSRVPEPVAVVVEPDRDSPLSFGAEFALRESAPSANLVATGSRRGGSDGGDCGSVERSDVHALLFRGRARAEIRGRAVELGECHPVLLAERLLDLARRAFDAWERGLPMHARSDAAGVIIGVRVSTDGQLALTLGAAAGSERRTVHTFPALGVADVLEAALTFGRSLVRAIVRRDRSQATNLRLSALRRSLRESTDVLRQASQVDSKINPTPEPYRAFARAPERRPLPASTLGRGRLRYSTRWRGIVPGIDLRSTYLCGGSLVVGASTEMWALDCATGRVVWRTDVARGTSVATPAGIVRIGPDGRVTVYDVDRGQRTMETRIAARVGGPMAGAVVNLAGQPRLVVVTEGEHHLVAIDLASGEPRWRWSWGCTRGSSRGTPRLKRSGRLAYFTCGDGALTALDVITGEVVWRLRDRLRFRAPPTVAHDAVFALSGGAHGVAQLYCIDPYSGRARWSTPVADPHAPCTVEGAPLVARGAVAVAFRQKTGVSLAAFRRDDGTPISTQASVVAPSGSSWLAVDDNFIGNTPVGDLVAIHAQTGELTWRHVLGPRPLDADLPRRLEPVLRGGALFVPCSLVAPTEGPAGRGTTTPTLAAGVCIVRPSDGALVGTIAPTEAIPDLLRVDEDCNVYVAEESGHLVSFGALPRLRLVS
jgi:outer membrane protein assembly factor BamB